MATYQEIYPSPPLLRSDEQVRPSARDLLSLEYFEADPNTMPAQVFDQHHILINLKDQPQRVENWRGETHRDFIFCRNEIVITPTGLKSGWQWHKRSKCIVITLNPNKLGAFSHSELGMLLTKRQLRDIPQLHDEDLTTAAAMLLDALRQGGSGSNVMFESLSRIFLVKLITRYAEKRSEQLDYSSNFTANHYKRVLDYVAAHFGGPIQIENIAREVGISSSHFSRLFKQVIGDTPYQFLMRYRIEQATKMLGDTNNTLSDIALACGFSDQPHLTRIFKQFKGMTPRAWCREQSGPYQVRDRNITSYQDA